MVDNFKQTNKNQTDSKIDPAVIEMMIKKEQAKGLINKKPTQLAPQSKKPKLKIKEKKLTSTSKKRRGKEKSNTNETKRQFFQESDPEEIERIINLDKNSQLDSQNQESSQSTGDQSEANEAENYNLGSSANEIADDQAQAESLRESRLTSLKDRKNDDEAVEVDRESNFSDLNPNNQTEQESSLNKQKTEKQQPNIPGIGSLTGGINLNDSPEEIIKKQIKKKIIWMILPWVPWIIVGLFLTLLLAFLIFTTAMVYDCASKMGWTQKASFGWSILWGDYEEALKKAVTGTCFEVDTTKIPSSDDEEEAPADSPQTTPPDDETTEIPGQ